MNVPKKNWNVPLSRSTPFVMPKKGYRKAASGWKRQSTSGKKMRKWTTKRMPLKKSYAITAPVNLGNGMPFAVRNSLSFSRNVILGTTLGVPTEYVFRGNSLYDPDFTGVGAQPLYFDQLMAVYNYFSVRSCAITVDVSSMDVNTPLIVVIYPSKESTAAPTSTNVVQLLQIPGAVSKPLSIKGGGQDVITLTNYFSTSTFFPDYSAASPDYRGTSGSNPTTAGSWFWHVAAYNADNGSLSSTAVANVRLTYYCDLYGLGTSTFS